MRVAIITNIPAPYRVDLYYYMNTSKIDDENIEWKIIYTNMTEENRCWSVDEKKLINSIILKSKMIKIRGKNDTRYIHLTVNIYKILSQIEPDVVIAFEYNPAAIQSLIWCKINKTKFVHLTDGTLNSEKKINLIQKIMRKIIIDCSDGFIASSTKAKEKLLAWGACEEKIEIAYLTTNIEELRKIKRKPCKGRILYVGSLIRRKGIDLLLNALSNIDNEFELHIVGDGTDEQKTELYRLAHELGIGTKIFLDGYKEGKNLMEEYSKADIFVLPTREDCFGMVLLEAAAAGIPIVSSKYADGSYDVIEDGINGKIADPFNKEEFANAISYTLNNCSKMKENNLTKFSYSEVKKGYVSAVVKVLYSK